MRSSYFEAGEKPYLAERLRVLLAVILSLFLILALNLAFIQIIRGRYYKKASRENTLRLVKEEAKRGEILDRNRNIIVENKALLNLFFIPHDLAKTAELASLSSILSLSRDDLEQRLKRKGSSPFEGILIKEGLTMEEVIRISEQNFRFPGIYIKEGICRGYPGKELASHIIGYVGHSGLELEYNQYLKGIAGGKEIEVDARGNLNRVLAEKKSEPGVDIVLTIDSRLQKKAEELLGEKHGAIVCLNPKNGEILALASSPDYDPRVFSEKRNREIEALVRETGSPLFNRTVQGKYPPGSIFKVITAGAFLEDGLGSGNTTFVCTGKLEIGRTFSCWAKEGHGSIGLTQAIAHSCDVYFYNLGLKTGIDRLSRYALACGLGKKTGIDLPYEENGFVPTRSWKERFFRILSQKRWYPGETMVMAIGQGYTTVTPLQMATLYAGIANEGRVYKPHLVKSMERGGVEVSACEPELAYTLPFKSETIAVIKRGLYEVVEGGEGTGTSARTDMVKSAGKTGTAQVVGIKKYEGAGLPRKYRDHAWFCGFAPYEAPELVIAVLVEHGGGGASVAAPLFKELVEFYFNLNKPPHQCIGVDGKSNV